MINQGRTFSTALIFMYLSLYSLYTSIRSLNVTEPR